MASLTRVVNDTELGTVPWVRIYDGEQKCSRRKQVKCLAAMQWRERTFRLC